MAKGKKELKKARNNKVLRWDELDMINRLDLVEGWARDGLTDLQMMENLRISSQLFYRWKREHPEFAEALRKGKDIVDRQVEKKLFDKAMGYEFVEETKEPFLITDKQGRPVLDKDGNEQYEMRVTKSVTKHIAPDNTSIIFWLKNRKPEQWRDKKNIEHEGQIGVANLEYMTDEELEKALKEFDRNE